MSRPSRARGLKQEVQRPLLTPDEVAPFAGAWIETSIERGFPSRPCVAPFAGAWIETPPCSMGNRSTAVAPFAGAWIETGMGQPCTWLGAGRALRGRVD